MGWAGGVRALAVFARRTSKTARAYAYSMAVRVYMGAVLQGRCEEIWIP